MDFFWLVHWFCLKTPETYSSTVCYVSSKLPEPLMPSHLSVDCTILTSAIVNRKNAVNTIYIYIYFGLIFRDIPPKNHVIQIYTNIYRTYSYKEVIYIWFKRFDTITTKTTWQKFKLVAYLIMRHVYVLFCEIHILKIVNLCSFRDAIIFPRR